jgi:hypothetical protein
MKHMKWIAQQAFRAALEAARENSPVIFLVSGLGYFMTGRHPGTLWAGALVLTFLATVNALAAVAFEIQWYRQMGRFFSHR